MFLPPPPCATQKEQNVASSIDYESPLAASAAAHKSVAATFCLDPFGDASWLLGAEPAVPGTSRFLPRPPSGAACVVRRLPEPSRFYARVVVGFCHSSSDASDGKDVSVAVIVGFRAAGTLLLQLGYADDDRDHFFLTGLRRTCCSGGDVCRRGRGRIIVSSGPLRSRDA